MLAYVCHVIYLSYTVYNGDRIYCALKINSILCLCIMYIYESMSINLLDHTEETFRLAFNLNRLVPLSIDLSEYLGFKCTIQYFLSI